MSFAALRAPTTRAADPLLPRVTWKLFLWGSTIYPAVYLLAAAVSAFFRSNDRPTTARRAAYVPLIYLAILLLCFVTALATGA